MHVIATAGHVDHGKSTLLRALTGMEPDRWAEEHRRGMTIDLGYVWTSLPTGETVAFVDVPGHQKFISNTLAGLGPVPAVLLVVAADEGWCRQTGEHLAALQALEVRHGILAVTRADLGDAALAAEEARDYLKGTTLEGIESVPVSAVTGTGLDKLRSALARMLGNLPSPLATPATRLWIDRVFTIRGAGTVLTGTLGSGQISVGDELMLAPSGELARVRKLEALKKTVEQAIAVSRVAVNVRGLSADQVRRGDALVTPSLWTAANTLDVRLLNPAEKMPSQAILHTGSAAVPARLRMLGPETARLSLAAPLPLHIGERALLRDPGEQRIVAGLIVLDPDPPSLRRRGGRARAEQLTRMDGTADPEGEVTRRKVVSREQLVSMGALLPDAITPKNAVPVGDWLVHQGQWTEWLAGLSAGVDQWAAAHPMAPGMPRNAVARSLDVPDQRILDCLIAEVTGLVSDSEGVHREGVSAAFPDHIQQALTSVRERLAADPFAAPAADELTSLGLSARHLATAVRAGLLLRVGDGVYLLPGAPDLAVRRLRSLKQPFTLSDARQALRTSRRVTVPLLESLDRAGCTRRLDTDRRTVQAC